MAEPGRGMRPGCPWVVLGKPHAGPTEAARSGLASLPGPRPGLAVPFKPERRIKLPSALQAEINNRARPRDSGSLFLDGMKGKSFLLTVFTWLWEMMHRHLLEEN